MFHPAVEVTGFCSARPPGPLRLHWPPDSLHCVFRAGTVPHTAAREVYLAINSCLHLALIMCNTEREKAPPWPRLCQSANTSWTVHVPVWFQRLLLRGFDKFTKTNTVRAFKHQSWLFFLRGNRIQTPRPNKWKHSPKEGKKKFLVLAPPPSLSPLLTLKSLNESRLGYM